MKNFINGMLQILNVLSIISCHTLVESTDGEAGVSEDKFFVENLQKRIDNFHYDSYSSNENKLKLTPLNYFNHNIISLDDDKEIIPLELNGKIPIIVDLNNISQNIEYLDIDLSQLSPSCRKTIYKIFTTIDQRFTNLTASEIMKVLFGYYDDIRFDKDKLKRYEEKFNMKLIFLKKSDNKLLNKAATTLTTNSEYFFTKENIQKINEYLKNVDPNLIHFVTTVLRDFKDCKWKIHQITENDLLVVFKRMLTLQ